MFGVIVILFMTPSGHPWIINEMNMLPGKNMINKYFCSTILILVQIKTSGSKIHTINIAVNTSTGYIHFCHEIFCLCVHLIELNWYQIAISH